MTTKDIDQQLRNSMIVDDIDNHNLSRKDVSEKYGLSSARIAQIYFHEKSKSSLENMEPEQIKALKVADLPLTFRLRGGITNQYGYNVLCGDINDVSNSELLRIPNFGRDTLREWREFQIKHGLIKAFGNQQNEPTMTEKLVLELESKISNLLDKIDDINQIVTAIEKDIADIDYDIRRCIAESIQK